MIERLEPLALTLSQSHSLQRSVHANHRTIRPSHLCANSIWCDYIMSGRQHRHLLAGSIRKAWNTPSFHSISRRGALYHLKLFVSSQITSPRLKMVPRVSSTADQQHRAHDWLRVKEEGKEHSPAPYPAPFPAPPPLAEREEEVRVQEVVGQGEGGSGGLGTKSKKLPLVLMPGKGREVRVRVRVQVIPNKTG